MKAVYTEFLFEDANRNRKQLFNKALFHAKNGKVLYILQEELDELPELSQDLSSVERHYIKMISFLYTANRISLIECLASLSEWQHPPATIILDSLEKFENATNIHSACGLVALLVDSARSCSVLTNSACHLFIAVTKNTYNEDYCNLFKELYCISSL